MSSRSYGSVAVRGTVWQSLARVLGTGVGALTTVLLARWLGPGGYGLVGLIGSLIAFFRIFADFGISPSIARFLARNSRSSALMSTILRQGLTLKLLTSIGAAAILAALTVPIVAILHEIDLRWLVPIGAVLLFWDSLSMFTRKALEGLCRFDIQAIGTVLSRLLYAVAGLWLVNAGWGARGAIIGQIIGMACGVIFAAYFIYAYFYAGQNPSSERLYSKIIGYSLPLFFISISFFVYTQSATLMVQYFLGKEQVGLYHLPVRLVDMLHLPATALGSTVAPLLGRASVERPDSLGRMYLKGVRFMLLLYIPAAIGLLVLAEPLIVVIFGEQFLAAVPIVRIYVPFLLSFSLASFLSLALDYLGYARLRAKLVGSSALLNVLLNLGMIPRFGIAGAAITAQLTYVPVVLIYVWLGARACGVSVRQILSLAGTIGGVAVVMGGLVFALRGFADSLEALILVIVFGAVLYSIGLFATRLVTLDELAEVRRYWRLGD
jgi:O-antigen/teichoic acid export membrane protein